MWAQLLLYCTGPIVIRVLTTLGLGVVSFVGFDSALNYIQSLIQSNFNALPADVAGFVFLSGIPTGMAMILSALFARIALMQLKKIQLL